MEAGCRQSSSRAVDNSGARGRPSGAGGSPVRSGALRTARGRLRAGVDLAVGFPVHGVGHGGDAPGLSRFGAGRLDSGRVLRSVGGRDARADRRRKGPLAVSAGPAGSRRSGSGPRGAEFFVASHRLLPAGGVRGGGEGFGAGLVGPGRVAAGSLLFHDVSPDRAVALPTATTQGEALRPRTPPSPQSAELCGGISRSA